jgi:multiple sugar transport system permease protein
MSNSSFKFEKANRGLMERLFEPPAVGKMAPVAKVVAYVLPLLGADHGLQKCTDGE